MAFDVKGNLYASASLEGRRGIVRITPDAKAELFLSGPAIVGVAFRALESDDPGDQQLHLSRRRRHRRPQASVRRLLLP